MFLAAAALPQNTAGDRHPPPAAHPHSTLIREAPYYMDPATGSFKVTFASGSADVAQALKDSLGDTVEITYGEPSRRGRLDDGNNERRQD